MADETHHLDPPVPDPTALTTAQLLRVVGAERDFTKGQIAILVERLNAMDKATSVLHDVVTRVPTDIQKEAAHLTELVIHLRELALEKFNSVQTQFDERDKRSERESKDNKVAVDAAFAAQKEAASEQNKSNTLAITKSEISTAETINKLAQLFSTTTNAISDKVDSSVITLSGKIDDVKISMNKLESRIVALENLKLGATEQSKTSQNSISQFLAVLGAVTAIVAIAVAVMIATKGR